MPLLLATGVTKSYGGVRVLDAVDFDLARGEVHALVGENGAGKSTLIKILGGAVRPDAGGVELDGRAAADGRSACRAASAASVSSIRNSRSCPS